MFDETKIYKYVCPETQEEKYDDPLRIHRLMREKTNGQLRVLCEMMAGAVDKAGEDGVVVPAHPKQVKEGAMAEGALIDAARSVFNLPYWDVDSQTGVLDQDVLDLVSHWIDWMNQKKSSGS